MFFSEEDYLAADTINIDRPNVYAFDHLSNAETYNDRLPSLLSFNAKTNSHPQLRWPFAHAETNSHPHPLCSKSVTGK